ncbi:hypothetical protein MJM83_31985, partial [Salmonella enterica subsp. enterica serovar Montevideo]|nr:hypothetical protein [Salmonella enterica subsp. enterica serovar Montevideo]
PKGWEHQRIVLRFDAVTHYGKVWVNDHAVMEHQGGYTPFEADKIIVINTITTVAWWQRLYAVLVDNKTIHIRRPDSHTERHGKV